MNLIKHTFGIALLTGMGLVFTTGNAQAQSFRHIDLLALRLQKEVEVMHDEVHAHFRPTAIYVHLDRDVAEMERLARHIHEVAHHPRPDTIRHLRHDVEQLDRLFHHIEDLIRSMRYRLDYRTMRHFRIAMSRINNTLHHLRDDLRVLDCPANHYRFGAGPHHGHAPHLRVAPRGGVGITIGRPGRGISFRLRLGH